MQIVKFNSSNSGFFSFNSYVSYLASDFIDSTCTFNLPTCALILQLVDFSVLTHALELITCGFELVTPGFEVATRGFELVTRISELVTHNS